MTETQHKIIFNRDMTERNLNEREKIMAHYWVIRHYMDGMQKALDEIGINDVIVEEK